MHAVGRDESTSVSGPEAVVRAGDWWALTLIVLGYAFYNLDKALVPVLIEPIKAEFELSDSQMGLLSGLAVSVPFAIACIPVGMLADRTNRRNLLAILIGGWSLVTGLTSLAANAMALFASRVGIGVFESGFTPVSLSQLSDRFPQRLRATAMGIFNVGAAGGLFMGMAMGGYVEDNYGWRAAFLIAGIPGILLAVLIWLTTREPARGGTDGAVCAQESAPGLAEVFGHMLRDRALRNIALGMTWGASMLAVFAVWTPSLFRRSFDLSATDAGLSSGLSVGLAGAIGAGAWGIVADRLGRDDWTRKMFVPIFTPLASCLCILLALFGGFGTGASTVLLGGAAFFGQGYIGTAYAMAATLAGPNRRAVTLSVLLVLFNLISYALGAGLIGKLSDMLADSLGTESLRIAYALGCLFFVSATFHFLSAWRDLRRRSQVAPQPA
jgi:predicted MFS family arabinose efflux permease